MQMGWIDFSSCCAIRTDPALNFPSAGPSTRVPSGNKTSETRGSAREYPSNRLCKAVFPSFRSTTSMPAPLKPPLKKGILVSSIFAPNVTQRSSGMTDTNAKTSKLLLWFAMIRPPSFCDSFARLSASISIRISRNQSRSWICFLAVRQYQFRKPGLRPQKIGANAINMKAMGPYTIRIRRLIRTSHAGLRLVVFTYPPKTGLHFFTTTCNRYAPDYFTVIPAHRIGTQPGFAHL